MDAREATTNFLALAPHRQCAFTKMWLFVKDIGIHCAYTKLHFLLFLKKNGGWAESCISLVVGFQVKFVSHTKRGRREIEWREGCGTLNSFYDASSFFSHQR